MSLFYYFFRFGANLFFFLSCSKPIFFFLSTLGASFLNQLALLQLQLFIKPHAWSKLPNPACFAPTTAFHQSTLLEQSSLTSLLYSNYSFSSIYTLGVSFPILLALLQLQLFIHLHSWSRLPKSACFTPTTAFHQSTLLEQAS